MKDSGEPCGAPPLLDSDQCFWHSPQTAREAAEARRLGGLRRRRENTLGGAYDIEGLRSIEDIQRLTELAMFDTLELPNSVGRSRALTTLALGALRALEVREMEQRLAAVEEVLQPRLEAGRKRR